jgi:hypothetical protein
MIEIEKIFPYTIVANDDSKYGIVDNKGNIVVPFEMDDIVNISDEEIGLELWDDYNCVCLVRDGMLGFFTNNGKYIEPAYLNYTVDPCGGDIHVETLEGYGILRAPKYILEEISEESSLLSEIAEDEEFDEFEDYEELDEYDDEEDFDLTLNQDTVDEEFQAGYKHAEAVMESFDASHDDIAEYIDQIHDELTDDFMTYAPITGAAAYMTEKYIGLADVPKLNKNIKKLYNDTEKDGYYALFRTIDCLLPHPEDTEDFVVSFSEGNRPTFTSPDVRGEIGDIYLYEHGMHMFYVSANIYDSDDPDELLEECCILDVDNVVLSELLTCLQNEIDPDRTNKELSENILKAADLEGDHEIGHILTDCGVYMLKTEDTYVHWWDSETLCDITGYMNAVYVLSDGCLNIVYMDSDNFPTSAEIQLTNPCLTRILDAIKAAANIAWNDYKNGK